MSWLRPDNGLVSLSTGAGETSPQFPITPYSSLRYFCSVLFFCYA